MPPADAALIALLDRFGLTGLADAAALAERTLSRDLDRARHAPEPRATGPHLVAE